ncbi:uncharacterized protein LOC115761356 [Drosophila novamexicana]|uniref:uncharacterized protein LOC115761356 n=1 Tax=Drosophila novamexicana TaxID=47314 RepID=UPI0011E588FA|nr:uncharacterized protein LOC115761356 [Drosophila novamexicana]
MKCSIIFLALILCKVQHITGSPQSFKRAEKYVHSKHSQPDDPLTSGHTLGRTRQTVMGMGSESGRTELANVTENYCCFWVYQGHPALPDIWEHRKEYAFDFLFNGKFEKNRRNYQEQLVRPIN